MRLSSESTSWTRTHPRHIDLSISKTSQLLCSPLPFLCHRLTRRHSYLRQALQAAGGIFISHRRISRFQSLHPVRSRSCNLLAVPLSLRRFSFTVRQRRGISRGRSRAPPISKSVRSSRRDARSPSFRELAALLPMPSPVLFRAALPIHTMDAFAFREALANSRSCASIASADVRQDYRRLRAPKGRLLWQCRRWCSRQGGPFIRREALRCGLDIVGKRRPSLFSPSVTLSGSLRSRAFDNFALRPRTRLCMDCYLRPRFQRQNFRPFHLGVFPMTMTSRNADSSNSFEQLFFSLDEFLR